MTNRYINSFIVGQAKKPSAVKPNPQKIKEILNKKIKINFTKPSYHIKNTK